MALDIRSEMMKLAAKRCAVDVQVHFGECEDLSNWNSFKKVLFLEDARISTYNTEDMGSLQSADEAVVNENVELSATKVYDITNMSFGLKAESIVTNEVIDVAICDEVSCGECGAPSSGCSRIFAVTKAAGGSPSTPADVVYSVDGGLTWYAHDIDTMAIANDPSGVDCLLGQLVVVSNSDASLHYAPLSDFTKFAKDPVWTKVTTGLGTGKPNAISAHGSGAFCVGDSGRIYRIGTPSAGFTVLDAGSLTISKLLCVHALSSRFCLIGGEDAVIIFTLDGTTFQLLLTPPVGVGRDITAVAAKSEVQWWVGTDDGRIFYTMDAGSHWTERTFSGSGAGKVWDIVFATDSIIYFSHATATPRGRVFASFNGGYDFTALPLGGGVMPNTDRFTALAACTADPGLLVAAGLADNGTDGALCVGAM
jgi:hypothetical protein